MEGICYEVQNQIAYITIDRVNTLNALNVGALKAMTQYLLDANLNDSVLSVIISANGDKAFCAGGDIKAEVDLDGYNSFAFCQTGQNLMRTMMQMRIPVISAIHGYALGAGMEIMLASDFCIVSEDVRAAIPSINIGSMPGFCGTQLLPRLVGAMRAKEILMTGRQLEAKELISLGLALKSVPRSALMNEAETVAISLNAKAPFAIRSIKQAVNKSMDCDLETGFLLEAQLFARVQGTDDKRKGMQAFLSKQQPEPYTNR